MSTILALPYREASQSGIISIALPAGVPIVATKVGSLPEVLTHEENSLLVEPNDFMALASAIKKLLSNPKLRTKLIIGGHQTIKTTISWQHTASKYYQLYQSVL